MTEPRVEILDDGAVVSADSHAVATKQGLPRWLLLVPLGLIGVIVALTTSSSPSLTGQEPATDPLTTTTVDVVAAEEDPTEVLGAGSRIVGNEAERLGLIHGRIAYTTVVQLDQPRVVAIRSGTNLMVIDSTELLAHRIRLPLSSVANDPKPHSMAIVLDKLIVSDGPLLRSLSVNGGVDLLLANDLVGYEVNGNQLLVAAEIGDSRFDNARRTELRVQGVHADFFGVPGERVLPDSTTVQWLGQRLFIERGGQVLVQSQTGLVVLGAGKVLAAGPNHALVQRCSALPGSQEIECGLTMSRLDGSQDLAVEDLEAVGEGSHVISPNGDQVFVVDDGSGVQTLLDLESGVWRQSMMVVGEPVTAAAFNADGQTLVLARGNTVQFWTDGSIVGSWEIDGFDTITEITVGG